MEASFRPIGAALAVILAIFLSGGTERTLGSGMGGVGDGANVDIIVTGVKVSPVRAHVGDVIRIDMRWVYWGDISNRYQATTESEIRANGKVVASSPFVYEYGASLGDEYRQTYFWDTQELTPGKYRIRGEVFLWLDATPYDNFLDVKDPVILLPPGAEFPKGQDSDGAAAAGSPYWR